MNPKDTWPTDESNNSSLPAKPALDLNKLAGQNRADQSSGIQEQLNDAEIIDIEARLKQMCRNEQKVADKELYKSEVRENLFKHAKSYLNLPEVPRVLYPGCDTDVTVADVFGKDTVDHLDLNNDSMATLKKEGYRVFACNSEKYQSAEPYDLIVFWNSGSTPGSLLEQIKPGGYVLANNYHGSANIISENLGFELIAGFDNDRMYSPGEMKNWIGSDYMLVDREAKIQKLTKEEAKRVEDQTVVESPHAPDNLFVFQKKS